MSVDEIAVLFYPPSTAPRHRGNSFTAIPVPDLIGVKERRYLERTGLERHESIGDLMRYAAMNQGADSLASYAGFVPPMFRVFSGSRYRTSRRYSDEQLYALARYLYSLLSNTSPSHVRRSVGRLL